MATSDDAWTKNHAAAAAATSVGYWPRLSQLQSVVALHSKTTTGATDRAKADLEWSPVFQQLGSSAFLKVQASSFTMWCAMVVVDGGCSSSWGI